MLDPDSPTATDESEGARFLPSSPVLPAGRPGVRPSGGTSGGHGVDSQTTAAVVSALVRLSWPTVVSSLASFTITFCALTFAGSFGANELSAAGLAVMIANSTGFSLSWGLLSALESLGAQAVGCGNFARLGLLTQRAGVVLTIAIGPVVVVWCSAEWISLQLQQPPEVARLCGTYARCVWWSRVAVTPRHCRV